MDPLQSQPLPLAQALRHAFDVLLPPTCLVCRRTTSTLPLCHRCRPPPICWPHSRCQRCFEVVPVHITLCQRCADVPQFIRAERYLWEYTPQARAVIHHMKYGPSLRLAGWLGREFGAHSSQLGLFLDWTHIVPIPGNPAHVAVRGFDQAQVIAASFLRSLSLKSSLLRTNLFTRPHAAKAQAETQHRDRFKNSLQSLSLKKRPWPGARVLLIDDVSTTGATAWHAAQLLRRAGAARVDVLTVARASSWGEFHFKRLALLSTKS